MNDIIENKLTQFLAKMKVPFENFNVNDPESLLKENEIVDFLQSAVKNPAEINEIITVILNHMEEFDDFRKNVTYYILGALVEFGGDPSICVESTVDRLKKSLENILSGTASDQVLSSINFVVPPVVAMLSRDIETRKKFQQDPAMIKLCGLISQKLPSLNYVFRLLSLTDDFDMLIIHPRLKKGMRIKAIAVQNNFHLITLLQGLILEYKAEDFGVSGAEQNDEAIKAALNINAETDKDILDKDIFNYYIWSALGMDKQVSVDSPFEMSFFGEMPAMSTPMIDGQAVVLLSDVSDHPRQWNTTYFSPIHESLKSNIAIVEDLSEEAVEAILDRIIEVKKYLSDKYYLEIELESFFNKISKINWFSNCGKKMGSDANQPGFISKLFSKKQDNKDNKDDKDKDKISYEYVSDLNSALKKASEDTWKGMKLNIRNGVSQLIFSSENFANWNEIAIRTKSYVTENVTPVIKQFIEKNKLDETLLHEIEWDIFTAAIEYFYVPDRSNCFYMELLKVYGNGNYPCGWSEGKMFVY
ncbi:MAG TPA: hypothetical protein VF941_00310 [Clostridia bacterium]